MKLKDTITALTPIVAIGGIVALECVAIHNGINGVLLSLSVAAITGIGGYEIKAVRDKLKGDK